MANTKRKKVINFGEPSHCSVATANGFIVVQVKKTHPSMWNRVKNEITKACKIFKVTKGELFVSILIEIVDQKLLAVVIATTPCY